MSATQTKIDNLTTKIEELTIQRDDLLGKLAREEALQNVSIGDVVSLHAGRGETRRVVVGNVIAVYEDDKTGKRVKVMVGIGADTQLLDTAVGQIISVQDSPKEASA